MFGILAMNHSPDVNMARKYGEHAAKITLKFKQIRNRITPRYRKYYFMLWIRTCEPEFSYCPRES